MQSFNIALVSELLGKQHWSELKTHLKGSSFAALLHQLFGSGAEPELTLREGNLRADLNVREQMEKRGARANVAVYDVLIIGYCAKGKLEDVNELLNEMLEKALIVKLLTK